MRTIPEQESLTVEFKSDQKGGLRDSELIDAVTGMTNTSGGDLYLGVEDDGRITGINPKHKDETGVTALIENKTVPSVSVDARVIQEDELDILKISIPISRSVISTSDGKILRRKIKLDGTPENIPMRPYEIPKRLSDLGDTDFSALVIPEASEKDLDSVERERLRNLVRERNGDSILLELDDEELDKALGIVRQGHPTVTGLLLIGKEESLRKYIPAAAASFQVLQGSDVLLNKDFHKPILAVFEAFEQYFDARNPEQEILRGLQRIPIPEFSPAAFREGLVNAFAHRDYSVLGRVRVALEDDGLTIASAGSFIEDITFQNLLITEPRSRNPLLASALKRIGLAEATGRGVDRIYEGSIQYGRPLPDYSESTNSFVKLFIPRHAADQEFMTMLLDYQAEKGRRAPIYSQLILSALLSQHRLTLEELTDFTNLSETRIRTHTEQLVEDGLIEARGNGKSRSFILSPKVYSSRGNLYGYIRQQSEESPENDKNLILQLAREQGGSVSKKEAAELLKVDSQKVYRLLKSLVRANLLKQSGSGRNTRYYLIET